MLAGARHIFASMAATLRRNAIVSSRYPLSVLSHVFFGGVAVALLLYSLAAFWPGGVDGILNTQLGRVRGATVIWSFIFFQLTGDTPRVVVLSMRDEQIEGTLEALCFSPSALVVHLTAHMLYAAARATITVSLAVVLACTAFGLPPIPHPLLLVLALACAVASAMGLALLLVGLALVLHETAVGLAQLSQIVLLTLCSPMVPFSMLPSSLTAFARLTPFSYCIDLYRYALFGSAGAFPELGSVRHDLIAASVCCGATVILGCVSFGWAERRTRWRGTLGHY
jgi:ABC-type multidrug transport system permease subunit